MLTLGRHSMLGHELQQSAIYRKATKELIQWALTELQQT